jgi:small subunit ribosomal protein S1
MGEGSDRMQVELGEGIRAICRGSVAAPAEAAAAAQPAGEGKPDLSSLSSMLNAKWKSGPAPSAKAEAPRAGQVRSFKIVKLDATAKKIELELA